jgi:hypothetical protein
VPAQDENTQTSAPAILAAVAAVMQQVTYVPKAGQYDGGRSGSYSFRKFEDTAAALGNAFRDHKIFVQSEVVSREIAEPEKKPYSSGSGYTLWTQVFVTVRYRFTSLIDGSVLEASAIGEGKDSSDKSSAKAMTMAMKSALTQAFMIATDERDPDSERPGDDAPPIGSGRGVNQQAEQQAQARRRQEQVARQGETPAEGDNSSEGKRQQFLAWVVEQLRPHTGEPTTLRRVASAYWHAHRLNMLQFETEGGVPLEHRIRAVLANFVQDARGAVPTVEEIDARAQGGQ